MVSGQQFPRCTSGFQHKIALPAENSLSEEIFPHNSHGNLLARSKIQGRFSSDVPEPLWTGWRKFLQVSIESSPGNSWFPPHPRTSAFSTPVKPRVWLQSHQKKVLFVHLTKIPSLHFVHVGWREDTAKRLQWKLPWVFIPWIRD